MTTEGHYESVETLTKEKSLHKVHLLLYLHHTGYVPVLMPKIHGYLHRLMIGGTGILVAPRPGVLQPGPTRGGSLPTLKATKVPRRSSTRWPPSTPPDRSAVSARVMGGDGLLCILFRNRDRLGLEHGQRLVFWEIECPPNAATA